MAARIQTNTRHIELPTRVEVGPNITSDMCFFTEDGEEYRDIPDQMFITRTLVRAVDALGREFSRSLRDRHMRSYTIRFIDTRHTEECFRGEGPFFLLTDVFMQSKKPFHNIHLIPPHDPEKIYRGGGNNGRVTISPETIQTILGYTPPKNNVTTLRRNIQRPVRHTL